jgi:beta-glucanase (GH16 family)
MKFSQLFVLLIFATITANGQLSNDSQFFLEWSEEFGEDDSFNMDGTKTSLEQMLYLRPRWNYNETNGWCQDLVNTDIDGNPTTELSYGTLKLRMVRRDTPLIEFDSVWCGGAVNPTGVKIRRYDKEDLFNRSIRPTLEHKFNYGYYELRFKLPPVNNGSSDGISFNWFSYAQDQNLLRTDDEGNPKLVKVGWAEIDFIEYSGKQDRFTHNYLHAYNDRSDTNEYIGFWPKRYLNEINFTSIILDPNHKFVPLEAYADFRKGTDPLQTPDADTFHTMSCEVTPQKITWYMDGHYLQSTVGQRNVESSLPDLPYMPMTLGLHTPEGFDPDTSGTRWDDTIKQNTLLPYEAVIDYLRFYRYTCGTDINRLENNSIVSPSSFQFTNLTDKVYGQIAIGPIQPPVGSIPAPRISASDPPIVLRAAEFIELLPGFEVAIGGEFYADVHNCIP